MPAEVIDMVSMRMTLLSRSPENGETKSKSFGNCIQGYAALVPYGAAAALPYGASGQYESFADWADAVGRALCSLSLNSYVDTQLAATFSTTEELM